MNLRKMILGEEIAIKTTIARAIDHAVKEKQRIRSQDMAVYKLINCIYSDREKTREKYRAYERLRDYKLNKIETEN